jgi:hypothetical protein
MIHITLNKHIQAIKPIWIVLLSVVLLMIFEVGFLQAISLFGIIYSPENPYGSIHVLGEKWVIFLIHIPIVVLIGPYIETLIFQRLFYSFFCKIKNYNQVYFVILGGMIFGFFHFTHWESIVITFIFGTYFNFLYNLLYSYGEKRAFNIIFCIHATINLIAISFKIF